MKGTSQHSEKGLKEAVLKAKERGVSDPEIGKMFGISFNKLQEIITEAYGVNISVLKKPKKIRSWEPKAFEEERTTVWSFRSRGNWATHDGRYRGNWSPYIPRNVIHKYSQPGEVVLDYFIGGGTTAIEAKLLGRRCIARDINPACIGLTLENLKFTIPQTLFSVTIYEPEVSKGDARNLSDIPNDSIDLICAHPPYAGIINYSSDIAGDLSSLSIEGYLDEMKKVAKESYRVLKPGRKCAILIGDTRKQKHVIPIGFQTINVFLESGFRLKELVIKRQHNCRTTGFWYKKSIKYNFLLLAHEYLPIFKKPLGSSCPSEKEKTMDYGTPIPRLERPAIKKTKELETTTVWLLPEEGSEDNIDKNVIERYSDGKRYSMISLTPDRRRHKGYAGEKGTLLFVRSHFLRDETSRANISIYLQKIKDIVKEYIPKIINGGHIIIRTQDVRLNGYIEPIANRIIGMVRTEKLWLKEIIIVAQEGKNIFNALKINENLNIGHQYLIVYEKKEAQGNE